MYTLFNLVNNYNSLSIPRSFLEHASRVLLLYKRAARIGAVMPDTM